MKKLFFSFFTLTILFITNGCNHSNGQSQNNTLSAIEFSEKISEFPNAIIIDVRTPEEFADGHIKNAININWRGDTFVKQVSEIDPTKPVFVYCLSGGRSAAAAEKMRESGFNQVYELDGGMMKWRAADMPESKETGEQNGDELSQEQYNAYLNSDKYVLIDFYAEWCAPCKMMKPSLEEIDSTMSDKVKVIRIDVDKNKELADQMQIDALPTLILYKNNAIVWRNVGFASKEKMVEQLK